MDIIHGDALEVDMETVCQEYVKKRDWEDGMDMSCCEIVTAYTNGVVAFASLLPLDPFLIMY